MKKKGFLTLVLLLLSLGIVVAWAKITPKGHKGSAMSSAEMAKPSCKITSDSVASLKLGMSIKAARMAAPTWQFKRSSDGEGAALIQVSQGAKDIMSLYTGEEDPESPIDEKSKIELIDVSDPNCKTAEGAYAGMLVSEVEKIYGKLVSIEMSEIESREFASFANQPKALTFRINEGAIYPPDSSQTTSYDKATTTLMQISIRH